MDQEMLREEIFSGLSANVFLDTQRILKNRLPRKPRQQLTRRELDLYRIAYFLLGELVLDGKVEVLFQDVPQKNTYTKLRIPTFRSTK